MISRDSLNFDENGGRVNGGGNETFTQAVIGADQGFQSVSSQQLLYDLHSTKNGAVTGGTNTSNSNLQPVTPIVQNYRYRSEHISKIRQRPSAHEIMNYHNHHNSVNSVGGGSSADDEPNSLKQH